MRSSAVRIIFSLVLIPFVTGAHFDHGSVHRRHDLVGRELNAATSLMKRQSYDNAKFTWYPVGLGSCGQTNVPSDYIVALDSALYDTGSHCFAPITITYDGKTAQATIVDRCEGCPMGGLDLSAGLFEYFADGDLGAPPLFGSWSYGSGETTTTAATTNAAPTSDLPPSTTSTYTPPPATSTTSGSFALTSSSSVMTSNSSATSSSVASTTTASVSASGSSITGAAQTSGTASVAGSAVPSTLELFNQAVLGMAGLVVAGPIDN